MIQLGSRRLNLGCGNDKREGFVNVDRNGYCDPDVQGDVLNLADFPSCYYDEIIALGVIEHFKRADTRRALYEWNRLLRPGGRLFLTTTYLDGLVRKLEAPSLQSVAGHELIVETLFAGQLGEGDYHLTAFTELLMRYYLWECGFDITQIGLMHGWLFEVEARKARDYSFVEALAEPDDAVFLQRLYREALHRDVDEAGLAQYGGALTRKEVARPEVVKQLLLGSERKQLMMAHAPAFPKVFDPRVALEDDVLAVTPKAPPFSTLARRIAGTLRRLVPGRA